MLGPQRRTFSGGCSVQATANTQSTSNFQHFKPLRNNAIIEHDEQHQIPPPARYGKQASASSGRQHAQVFGGGGDGWREKGQRSFPNEVNFYFNYKF